MDRRQIVILGLLFLVLVGCWNTNNKEQNITRIEKVSVQDSIIYIISSDSSLFKGERVKSASCIVVPKQKIEEGKNLLGRTTQTSIKIIL